MLFNEGRDGSGGCTKLRGVGGGREMACGGGGSGGEVHDGAPR